MVICVTLTFDLTHDLDMEFSRPNIDKAVSEVVGLIEVKRKESESIRY